MVSQFAAFRIPVEANSPEQEEMNRFLHGCRVIQFRQKFVDAPGGTYWSFMVQYNNDKPNGGDGAQDRGERKDYKAILSPEDFRIYNRLRAIRKELAEAAAVPLYAVFSNDQLSAIARAKPASESELKQVDGIGDAKCAKYGAPIIAAFTEVTSGTDRIPF